MAPRRTKAGGVGYTLVQCKSAKGTLAARRISTEGRTDSIEFIPVLNITGLPARAICFTRG